MRIGLLGGMFDPVHIGHLRPALELLHRLELDEVRLVPCAAPPHRGDASLDAEWRVALLEEAVADIDGLVVDDRELRLPPPSYTVQTLRDLQREQPDDAFILAMGEDAFRGFCRWHDWQGILELTDIVMMHRPGILAEFDPEVSRLLAARETDCAVIGRRDSRGAIAQLEVTPLAVSSTEIRDMLAHGEDPRFLVPDAVRQRILENNLYGNR